MHACLADWVGAWRAVQAGLAVMQADAPDVVPFLGKTFGSSIGEPPPLPPQHSTIASRLLRSMPKVLRVVPSALLGISSNTALCRSPFF